MQNDRSQDRRSPFDLFGDVRGFGGSIFGKDPFDDPFFTTRPFGSMLKQNNLVGESHSVVPPAEPLIQELNSDDDDGDRDNERKEGPNSARPLNAPFVNHPDDESDDGEKDTSCRTDYNKAEGAKPQTFKVQTCKVSYGGVDGVYYSTSSTRRMGSDGGHSVTRKLNPDGKVDTSQMLHNLNEDELGNFEDAWQSNSGSSFPTWAGPRGSSMDRISNSFLLPSTRNAGETGLNNEAQADGPSNGQRRKVIRIPID